VIGKVAETNPNQDGHRKLDPDAGRKAQCGQHAGFPSPSVGAMTASEIWPQLKASLSGVEFRMYRAGARSKLNRG
jgi:hypothetical protein